MVKYFDDNTKIRNEDTQSVRNAASLNSFLPKETVKCRGDAVFRTQAARDLACLLDIDPDVDTWQCLPLVLGNGGDWHIPDFVVDRRGTRILADSGTGPDWACQAAVAAGYIYEVTDTTNSKLAVRLQNARDLLRYAGHRVVLGDKVRLLAFLEEHGSMPIVSCLPLLQHCRDPIGVIARLCLDQALHIALDDEAIGPETRVRRIK
ncbi:hypothetical protein [Phyllobacterium sophorae]|uniref:TnsA endonuclease N-terminal domain-containing protein n=1 Tax=Phyllobacterium sophorae TaxID=1520277 RepID=A0A2P7BFQ5_9HYPH|nr:hypothetical protein [Phyllobacterium sophorae]PSH65297.1 hypothetical protein CU103_09860 [Phyllobacterium sophorae]